MRKLTASIVVAALTLVVVPSPAEAEDGYTFRDIDGNEHADMIQALADAGITAGCDATGELYCPAGLVTRGQAASFLVRALVLPPGETDHFTDDNGSEHEPAINRLADEEIALGVDESSYAPSRVVTREQLASLLVRAFELTPKPGDRFEDVEGTHEPNVNAIAEEGIARGCSSDGLRYCPKDPVRRDQLASFLGRALGFEDGTEVAGPAESQTETETEPPSGADDEGTTAVEEQPTGDPPDDPSAPPPEYVTDVNQPQESPSPDAVARYWSDRRLESAETESMPGFAPSGGRLVESKYDAAFYSPDQRVLQSTSNWQRTPTLGTGRLYFTKPNGANNTCSATVVGPTTLLTAAHCVVDGSGDFTNFLFIPSQQGTYEPYGRWSGTVATYYTEYLQGNGADYVLDYALIYVPPTGTGARLGDVVGTWPVLKNSHELFLERYATGYPVDGWFGTWGGGYPWYCQSTDVLYYDWGNGWASKGSGCTANGGFSGGPIFELWNGRWYVASVNSTMTYAHGNDGSFIAPQDVAGFTAARSQNWLYNVWGPSFNDWYDHLVNNQNR